MRFTTLYRALLFLFVLFLPLANQDRYFLFHPKLYPSTILLVILILFGFPLIWREARKRQFWSDKYFLVLLLLFGVRALSLINSQSLTNSLLLLTFFGSVIALYLILKNSAQTDKSYFAFLFQLYLMVVVVIGFFGLLQYLLALIGVVLPGVLKGGNYFRIPSTFYDANHLPPFISTGLFFFLGFSFLAKNIKQKLGFLALGLVLALVSVLTFSRSGFLGMAVGSLTFGLLSLRKGFGKKLLPIVLALLVFVGGVLYLSHQTHYSLVDRMFKSLFDPAEKSTVAHYELLLGEWELFLDNPILGVGYGGFSEAFRASEHSKGHTWIDPVKDIRLPAHSIWLETLAETGVVGFIPYLLFMLLVTQQLFRGLSRASTERDKIYLMAFVSGFFALLSGGIFYSYNLLFFWYFIFVGLIYSKGL
jgi:O-antigen ligase